MPAKRPKGERYRGLYFRGGVIQYEVVVNKKRKRFSCHTDDWDVAAAVRDEKLAREAERAGQGPISFLVAAQQTIESEEARPDDDRPAPTTLAGLRRALREDGPILPTLGNTPVDQVDIANIRDWWNATIEGKRAPKTGRNLLDVIQTVLVNARFRGLATGDPVKEWRDQLAARTRTRAARKKRKASTAKDAVLTPEEVGRLIAAAEAEGLEPLIVVLLAVECGMRRGEISALTWGDVCFGQGEDDPTRHVEITKSRSSGIVVGDTKSGKSRRPHISRRLHRALRDLQRERFKPSPDAEVVELAYDSLSHHCLRRCLERAGLPKRSFQNLRATATSLLKTWGVAEVYVRTVIGHDSAQVAAQHYDHFDFTTYRAPEPIGPGEVPQDLFERLCSPGVPTVVPTVEDAARAAMAQPLEIIEDRIAEIMRTTSPPPVELLAPLRRREAR